MSSYQLDSFDISGFCTRHNRAVKTAPRIFTVAKNWYFYDAGLQFCLGWLLCTQFSLS